MKYSKLVLGLVAVVLTVTAWTIHQKNTEPKVMVLTQNGWEEKTVASLQKQSPEQMRQAEAKAKEIFSEDPGNPEPLPENLSQEDLDSEVKRIDDLIEQEYYIERANQGELSAKEMRDFRRLLRERNQLFERKVDLALREK